MYATFNTNDIYDIVQKRWLKVIKLVLNITLRELFYIHCALPRTYNLHRKRLSFFANMMNFTWHRYSARRNSVPFDSTNDSGKAVVFKQGEHIKGVLMGWDGLNYFLGVSPLLPFRDRGLKAPQYPALRLLPPPGLTFRSGTFLSTRLRASALDFFMFWLRSQSFSLSPYQWVLAIHDITAEIWDRYNKTLGSNQITIKAGPSWNAGSVLLSYMSLSGG